MKSFDLGNSRRNNFDFIRFALASLVVFSHSWPLVNGPDALDPLGRFSGRLTLGELAVDGFFVISGFLISQSWARSSGWKQFLKKRVLRIYPGFVAMTLICAFVLAPIATDGSAPLFSARQLSMVLYQCVNLASFPYGGPSVFATNPVRFVMNGSIWTIRFEFLCYILIAILGICNLLGRRWWLLLAFVASVLWYNSGHFLPWNRYLTAIVGWGNYWPRFLTFYLSGVCAFLFRQDLRPSPWIAAFCAITSLVVALFFTNRLLIVLPICGTYLILWGAFTPFFGLDRFGRWGDFSYGLYLYAFPIQQVLVQRLGDQIKPIELFVYALPLSVAAGALSWHLVEKHFLEGRAARRRMSGGDGTIAVGAEIVPGAAMLFKNVELAGEARSTR